MFRQVDAKVTATATADGTSTYALQIPAISSDGQVVSGKSLTAWMDARNFLPVRFRQDVPATMPGWTEDYTWERATPQRATTAPAK